jgi:hypothetical protein
MKELGVKEKIGVEISIKEKKQIEHRLIDTIFPFQGHKTWEVNNETLHIEIAKYSICTYQFEGENAKEIIIKKGYTYISALNKKNALKKFIKGQNGSKPKTENPITL